MLAILSPDMRSPVVVESENEVSFMDREEFRILNCILRSLKGFIATERKNMWHYLKNGTNYQIILLLRMSRDLSKNMDFPCISGAN